jgi:hypothetical protein
MFNQTDPAAKRRSVIARTGGTPRPSGRSTGHPSLAVAGDRPPCADTPAPGGETWARLCHEIRTPLNAILGNAELLLDGSAGPLSGQARSCLGDICAAGHRLMRDVQTLLDLCHVTTSTLVSEVALDLLKMLERALAAAGNGTLQVRPADARLIVQGDVAWLGALATTIAELSPADRNASSRLMVAVQGGGAAGRDALVDVMWAGFSPDRADPLRMALVDAIVVLHGGSTAVTAEGVRLHWPASRALDLEPGRPVGR